MVHLSRIYTRTGDDGVTSLGDGTRIPKADLRVETYGTVDEANAAIGLAHAELLDAARDGGGEASALLAAVADVLRVVQNDLFDVGADLCTPTGADERPGDRLRVTDAQVAALEGWIDRFNEPLGDLKSFVLPGGSRAAAMLHVARTVTRRAERLCSSLAHREPDRVTGAAGRYLNRLSDLLFVLARAVNAGGAGDVLWVPGGHRSEGGGS